MGLGFREHRVGAFQKAGAQNGHHQTVTLITGTLKQVAPDFWNVPATCLSCFFCIRCNIEELGDCLIGEDHTATRGSFPKTSSGLEVRVSRMWGSSRTLSYP